jgi:hypothetical protein
MAGWWALSQGEEMETLIVIAMLALSLFGPGWSSGHKAYWEWQLGRPLEGYEEHRLARGEWNPYGGPLFPTEPRSELVESRPESQKVSLPDNPLMICRQMVCMLGGDCTCMNGWEPVF